MQHLQFIQAARTQTQKQAFIGARTNHHVRIFRCGALLTVPLLYPPLLHCFSTGNQHQQSGASPVASGAGPGSRWEKRWGAWDWSRTWVDTVPILAYKAGVSFFFFLPFLWTRYSVSGTVLVKCAKFCPFGARNPSTGTTKQQFIGGPWAVRNPDQVRYASFSNVLALVQWVLGADNFLFFIFIIYFGVNCCFFPSLFSTLQSLLRV